MKKFMILMVALVTIAFSATAFAATTATLGAQGKDTQVGGLPLFVSFTQLSDTGTFTLTTPAGFLPDVIQVVNDSTTTNPDIFMWYKGMAAASYLKITGSTGVITYVASNGFTPTAGSIVFGTGVQTNAKTLKGFAIRYAQ